MNDTNCKFWGKYSVSPSPVESSYSEEILTEATAQSPKYDALENPSINNLEALCMESAPSQS